MPLVLCVWLCLCAVGVFTFLRSFKRNKRERKVRVQLWRVL